MEKVRFKIWVKAFSWTRDAEAGIARAYSEGEKFGHKIVDAWAVGVC